MSAKDFEKKLSELGFPLMEVHKQEDAHQTLAEVVQSQDARYWEGFPVLLANAAKERTFRYEVVDQYLSRPDHKQQLKELFLLAQALYEVLHLKFSWTAAWRKHAPKADVLMEKKFEKQLESNQPVEAAGRQFYAQRLKEMFYRYYENEAQKSKALEATQDALSLEYVLSQVFSPKQKELFKKKLSGEKLTKTEREYYSRTVKKKVLALANSELHRLAMKLME